MTTEQVFLTVYLKYTLGLSLGLGLGLGLAWVQGLGLDLVDISRPLSQSEILVLRMNDDGTIRAYWE